MAVDFNNPPVRETVIAFEYQRVPGLGTRELVHLQDSWQRDFSRFEDMPPIPSPPTEPGPQLVMSDEVEPLRLWSIDDEAGMLLQLQTDRLILNWRAGANLLRYPRYASLRADFAKRWGSMCAQLSVMGLQAPHPERVEFTYVNEIDDSDGHVWTEVLAVSVAHPSRLPGDDGLMAFHMSRPVADAAGDIAGAISVNARRTGATGPSTMVISTRLEVAVSRDPFSVLDLAHDMSLMTFEALTTEEAHRRWGRRA